MRLEAAALRGFVIGIATVGPVALLAWLSLRPSFYAGLGLDSGIADALIDTAASGWPRLWPLLAVPWIDGPTSLLLIGISIGLSGAVGLALLVRVFRLDPGSLAAGSVRWALRNALHWRFLGLVFGLSAVSWAVLKLDAVGPIRLAILFLLWAFVVPWQVNQPSTVNDRWIGEWWHARRPGWKHAIGMVVIGLVSFLVALAAWVGEALASVLASAALAHLLMRSARELDQCSFKDLSRPLRFSRWLLTMVYVAVLSLPLLGLIAAVSLANLFGAPVIKQVATVALLPLPDWWAPYTIMINAVADHWWMFFLPLIWPWSTLLNARLAHLEIAMIDQTLRSDS